MKKFTTDETVFIMDGAHVMGDVAFGEGCSVWYGAVLRGDSGPIRLGRRCNVQDNAVLHGDGRLPTVLEDGVTVGHNAVVHSAHVGSHSLIGMGAVVISGARIGSCCMVAAGAVVTPKAVVPDGMLVAGNPARILRPLTPEELAHVRDAGDHYYALSQRHRELED